MQKMQFKIERNFKSPKFAWICDFHIILWGYTLFLDNNAEGNEYFDTTQQVKAYVHGAKSKFSFPSGLLSKNSVQ